MNILTTLITCGLLAAPQPHLVWGSKAEWVLTDANGIELERFERFGNLIADDLAVSPDGTRFAILVKNTQGREIFKWSRGREPSPVDPTKKPGFFADPTFSADGEEVLYSASPDSSGVGHNVSKEWAQIWATKWSDGTKHQLTSGRGCHIRALATRSNLHFLHADCGGAFRVVRQASGREPQNVTDYSDFDELGIAPHGIWTVRLRNSYAMIALLTKSREQQWITLRGDSRRLRPASSAKGGLLFQNDGAVWHLASPGSKPMKLFSFKRDS